VLDLVPRAEIIHLVVRQASPDALDASPRLREIVDEMRVSMPVEVRDVEDVLDADRPMSLLLPGGVEQRVEGEWLRVLRDGQLVEEIRAPWLERQLRRGLQKLNAWRLGRWPSHEDRLARLGLPSDKLPPSPTEEESP
jgi:hypothetical protein